MIRLRQGKSLQNHIKVIPFPQPDIWSFCDYVEGGKNLIQAWYDELSDEGKLNFDSLLKNTHKIPNQLQWGGFKFLKGEPKRERIWQLDFIADKRQYRLLGVFAGQKRAALLLGCYHKGDVYTPHAALETATKRAKNLREGRASTVGRKIKLDF